MLDNAGSYYFACIISTGFHFQRLDHGSNKLARDDAVMMSGEALIHGWVVNPYGAIGKRDTVQAVAIPPFSPFHLQISC